MLPGVNQSHPKGPIIYFRNKKLGLFYSLSPSLLETGKPFNIQEMLVKFSSCRLEIHV